MCKGPCHLTFTGNGHAKVSKGNEVFQPPIPSTSKNLEKGRGINSVRIPSSPHSPCTTCPALRPRRSRFRSGQSCHRRSQRQAQLDLLLHVPVHYFGEGSQWLPQDGPFHLERAVEPAHGPLGCSTQQWHLMPDPIQRRFFMRPWPRNILHRVFPLHLVKNGEAKVLMSLPTTASQEEH